MRARGLRFLVLHLPAFRLERCGYEADELAGLIDEVKNAMRLVALTPGARREGLQIGMTASAARARVPEIALHALHHRDEERDRAALVRAFSGLSDRVAFPWDEELVLEISGVSALFGGEEGLMQQARGQAEHLGHRCHIAVADHPLAAAALAVCSGCDTLVPTGDGARRLAALPVSALRLSTSLHESLVALGVELMGDFAKLDPASIAGRFGTEGARLHRVARGGAASDGTMGWGAIDDEPPQVSARMGGAISTLQLHFVLPGLLSLLSRKLGARDEAVVRLQLVLRRESRSTLTGANRSLTLGVRVGRPTREPGTLERLIRHRLENLRIPAPVEDFLIRAIEVAPDLGWQPGLTDRAEATEPLPDLLARLVDHLGDEVFSPVLVDSWKPETSWERGPYPPRSTRQPLLVPIDGVAAQASDPVEVQEAWEAQIRSPRPALLLENPEPLRVRCVASRPEALHLERGWVHVQRCEGPERLQGLWWNPEEEFRRDYWVILADDRVAWIFLEEGQWLLHGWFD